MSARRPVPPPTPSPQLTVAAIARAAAAAYAEKCSADEAVVKADIWSPDRILAQAHFDKVDRLGPALADLGLLLPVRTLADATAWSVLAFTELDALLTDIEGAQDGVAERLGVLLRGVAGVAILLAREGGHRIEDYTELSTLNLMLRQANVEVVA